MWQAAQWICALIALSCGTMPDVAVIQSAYDREATLGNKLHDKSLQVLQAKCNDDGTDKYLCEITFISKGDPIDRSFFDIVTVARAADGWELKSGLCKN
jgi:predicted PolB exonuclease-like 3'-5' exonuclease